MKEASTAQLRGMAPSLRRRRTRPRLTSFSGAARKRSHNMSSGSKVSDNNPCLDMVKLLPPDIVDSILLPLSPPRLQQLRLVSKSWNSLIKSRDFRRRYFSLAHKKWWLGLAGPGTNVAYHSATNKWHSFSIKKVFGTDLGPRNWNKNSYSFFEDDEDDEDEEDWSDVKLTWTSDGALSCCMDEPGDDEYMAYDSDDICPRVRLVVFDSSGGCCKEITDIKKSYFPVGVGIEADPDGENFKLVIFSETTYAGETEICVLVYDSSIAQKKWGTSCKFNKVKRVYSSNFVMQGCFYFLLMYDKSIRVLYYKLASDSWYFWDTALNSEKALLEMNLIRCGGKLLSIWANPDTSDNHLAILELKKPPENENLEISGGLQGFKLVLPPAKGKYDTGTVEQIASVPEIVLSELEHRGFKVVGNEYFIYWLPETEFTPGQKGMIYSISSSTWQWMAPFPEKCRKRRALRSLHLLGNSSVMLHHPKYFSTRLNVVDPCYDYDAEDNSFKYGGTMNMVEDSDDDDFNYEKWPFGFNNNSYMDLDSDEMDDSEEFDVDLY